MPPSHHTNPSTDPANPSAESGNPSTGPANRAAEARRRKATLLIALVAGLTVLVPFLFWKQTWFGELLTDEQLSQYLSDQEKPRHRQHALVQMGERIGRGDASAQRWYPQAAALKDSPVVELRVTLAWLLGTDNRSELFHQTLLAMMEDPDLVVRRNVALSLVRFGDAGGRAEILTMLQPYAVRAPEGGTLRYRLMEGNLVESGTLLARLEQTGGAMIEIRSPLPGKFRRRSAAEGAVVSAGREIAILGPGEEHVWEALRALYVIGLPEDLPLIEPLAQKSEEDFPEKIREQAALTAAEIRRRSTGQ